MVSLHQIIGKTIVSVWRKCLPLHLDLYFSYISRWENIY